MLSAATLIGGFIIDYLTLRRVDFLFDNLLIVLYLIFTGVSIFIVNLYEAGKLRTKFVGSIYEFLPFLLQFSFGGLFSAFVVFYSKSASLFTSGAFVLILLTLLIGNEFFKERYSKLVFQVVIFFVALFSFSIYFLPVVLRQMSVAVFLWSGALSLGLVGVFIFVISRFAPHRYKESEKRLIVAILAVYAIINILYFTNIIPPIPLSFKGGDVYHRVERREDGNYLVTGEADVWQEKFNLGQTVHLVAGEPVYVLSSVFAPTDLNIKIVHNWQYLDEEKVRWKSASKISFPIRGGRDEGYRGFSSKANVFPGHWRVDIETDRGQVIGRIRFDIEMVDVVQNLEAEVI